MLALLVYCLRQSVSNIIIHELLSLPPQFGLDLTECRAFPSAALEACARETGTTAPIVSRILLMTPLWRIEFKDIQRILVNNLFFEKKCSKISKISLDRPAVCCSDEKLCPPDVTGFDPFDAMQYAVRFHDALSCPLSEGIQVLGTAIHRIESY